MTGFRSIAYLALGGNLPSYVGAPEITLLAAKKDLSDEGLTVQANSRLFATPCFPEGAGPNYVNAVVSVQSTLAAHDLLAVLHRIEAKYHRKRDQRWGMRTLDLDLLAFGDRILPDLQEYETWLSLPPEDQINRTPDQLILPHPRLQDRAFVLVPLCDVAPDWVHPVLQKSARDLCADLPAADVASVRPL